ncbi:MAG: DsbC family protein [Usitatibacteraceae bacterium]
MIRRISLGVALTVSALNAAGAEDTPPIAATLAKLYPATSFETIKPTPVPGVFEVVAGKNVMYVDATGRYFFFGHLFDMSNQQDLTPEVVRQTTRVDFSDLPLADAIKVVRGAGSRSLAIFSDPDCAYCRKLESELAKLTDVTLYTFPFVLLNPDSAPRAVSVWCSPDPAKSWARLLAGGHTPAASECPNPIQRNIALAQHLGVTGTPTLINQYGRVLPGAASAAQIDAFLTLRE